MQKNQIKNSTVYIFFLVLLFGGFMRFKYYHTNPFAKMEDGLYRYYKDYFPIGVAISAESLNNSDSLLINNQFNSITAENAMKMGPIHPEEDRYNWEDADKIVNYAFKKGKKGFKSGFMVYWVSEGRIGKNNS